MTIVTLALGLAGVLALGGLALALLPRRESGAGDFSLLAGAAYPVGALIVAAWLGVLAFAGIAWTVPTVILPIALLAALLGYCARRAIARVQLRALVAALVGRNASEQERWLWLPLLAWLALRAALLALELTSRPPLPWEAWIDSAARGAVWYSKRGLIPFVDEAGWVAGAGYLAGLRGTGALAPLLDVWTLVTLGRVDDTLVHAPWMLFWLSQPLLVFGAMRSAGAVRVHALAAAALVATLPLSSAHAALGGTSALLLATYLLGAVVFAHRWSRTKRVREGAITVAMVAGLLASAPAGALWALTLLPLLVAALARAHAPKAIGGMVAVAAFAAIALARADVTGLGAAGVPPPGLLPLVEHAFLLGNWHLLAYAAVALALFAWREWRAPPLLPLSGTLALGVIAVIGLATSPSARPLLVSTGVIGQAATVLAPVLTLWTALVAYAWLERWATAALPPQPAAAPAD